MKEDDNSTQAPPQTTEMSNVPNLPAMTGAVPIEQTQQSSALPLDMDLTITDSELTDILQDMDMDFGTDLQGGSASVP